MNPLTFRERVQLRIATADQQYAARKISTLPGVGSTQAGRHPWLTGLGERVLTQLANPRGVRMCPHLGRRGPEPMHGAFVRDVLILHCRDCRPPRLGPIDDYTCDRCSIYAHRHGLVFGFLPIGPLLLGFGVCRACGDELGMVKEEVPA